MGMQTDVLASKVRTTAGQLLDQNSLVIGRCRVKGIYIVPNSAVGEVVFRFSSVALRFTSACTPVWLRKTSWGA